MFVILFRSGLRVGCIHEFVASALLSGEDVEANMAARRSRAENGLMAPSNNLHSITFVGAPVAKA